MKLYSEEAGVMTLEIKPIQSSSVTYVISPQQPNLLTYPNRFSDIVVKDSSAVCWQGLLLLKSMIYSSYTFGVKSELASSESPVRPHHDWSLAGLTANVSAEMSRSVSDAQHTCPATVGIYTCLHIFLFGRTVPINKIDKKDFLFFIKYQPHFFFYSVSHREEL